MFGLPLEWVCYIIWANYIQGLMNVWFTLGMVCYIIWANYIQGLMNVWFTLGMGMLYNLGQLYSGSYEYLVYPWNGYVI